MCSLQNPHPCLNIWKLLVDVLDRWLEGLLLEEGAEFVGACLHTDKEEGEVYREKTTNRRELCPHLLQIVEASQNLIPSFAQDRQPFCHLLLRQAGQSHGDESCPGRKVTRSGSDCRCAWEKPTTGVAAGCPLYKAKCVKQCKEAAAHSFVVCSITGDYAGFEGNQHNQGDHAGETGLAHGPVISVCFLFSVSVGSSRSLLLASYVCGSSGPTHNQRSQWKWKRDVRWGWLDQWSVSRCDLHLHIDIWRLDNRYRSKTRSTSIGHGHGSIDIRAWRRVGIALFSMAIQALMTLEALCWTSTKNSACCSSLDADRDQSRIYGEADSLQSENDDITLVLLWENNQTASIHRDQGKYSHHVVYTLHSPYSLVWQTALKESPQPLEHQFVLNTLCSQWLKSILNLIQRVPYCCCHHLIFQANLPTKQQRPEAFPGKTLIKNKWTNGSSTR